MRLHDDMEALEEKRARYEEELDRVNDLLTESETRRQSLQKEVDMLVEQVCYHSEHEITAMAVNRPTAAQTIFSFRPSI